MCEQQNNIIVSDKDPLPVTMAVASLRHTLEEFMRTTPLPLAQGLYTFIQPIQQTDPLLWLQSQTLFPRTFWKNREKNHTFAGIGAADSILHDEPGRNSDSFELLIGKLSNKNHSARYIGGFRFNNLEIQDETWNSFPSFSFVLPLVQLPSKMVPAF